MPVPIKIGASIGNWIQVTGSIQAGDRVVVEGNERLRPNQDVQVTKEIEEPLEAAPCDIAQNGSIQIYLDDCSTAAPTQ